MKHRMNLAEAYNLIIDFHQDFEDLCSIYFVRRQFPHCLCFAVTINKSQGQMFSGRVGIYSKNDPFALGHIYVALSRATSPRNIYSVPPTPIYKRIGIYLHVVVTICPCGLRGFQLRFSA